MEGACEGARDEGALGSLDGFFDVELLSVMMFTRWRTSMHSASV